MSKKYFTENISDETLAKLIDKTLNFEKNKGSDKKMKINLLKIIPAVAAVALVIGIVNILPVFVNKADDESGNVGSPGVYASPINTNEPEEEIELFVPVIIEKSFFEDKVLSAIPESSKRNKITAYYIFSSGESYSRENTADGIITTYSLSSNAISEFYALDPNITARESNLLLEVLREHTDLTGNDIMQMYNDLGVLMTETPDPYAHVRFGETRDILLLDVEWHTYESYQEYIDKYIEERREYYNSDEFMEQYMQMPDEYREKYTIDMLIERDTQSERRLLGEIKNANLHVSKSVNGKENAFYTCYEPEKYTNENGYMIYRVYPHDCSILYFENFDEKIKSFGMANSKREYERIVKNEIIPFYDEFLEKGLINQEQYDSACDYYTTFDPLEYYIDLYFN